MTELASRLAVLSVYYYVGTDSDASDALCLYLHWWSLSVCLGTRSMMLPLQVRQSYPNSLTTRNVPCGTTKIKLKK